MFAQCSDVTHLFGDIMFSFVVTHLLNVPNVQFCDTPSWDVFEVNEVITNTPYFLLG